MISMYLNIFVIHIAKKERKCLSLECSQYTYLTERYTASSLGKPIPLAKNIQHSTYGAKGWTLVNPNIIGLYLC